MEQCQTVPIAGEIDLTKMTHQNNKQITRMQQ